ncbi:hypothetical protein [Vibrio sp.]|uniref:hypothetical protein n=1 Tax=Vibrio sp. TaxID=678 RepID=UPI003D0DF179
MTFIQDIRETKEEVDKGLSEFISTLEKEWFKASDDKKNIKLLNCVIRGSVSNVSEIVNKEEDIVCRFKIDREKERLTKLLSYLTNKRLSECKSISHILVSKAHLIAYFERTLKDWTSLAIGKLELGSNGYLDISSADSQSFKQFIESVQLGEDLDKSLLVKVADALVSTVVRQVGYTPKAVSKPVGRPKSDDKLKRMMWAYSEVYNCKKAAEKFHTSESNIKKIRTKINDEEKKFRDHIPEQEYKEMLEKHAKELVDTHKEIESYKELKALEKKISEQKIQAIQAGGALGDISIKVGELEKEYFKALEQFVNE